MELKVKQSMNIDGLQFLRCDAYVRAYKKLHDFKETHYYFRFMKSTKTTI